MVWLFIMRLLHGGADVVVLLIQVVAQDLGVGGGVAWTSSWTRSAGSAHGSPHRPGRSHRACVVGRRCARAAAPHRPRARTAWRARTAMWRELSTVATTRRRGHFWLSYSASGSGVPGNRERPSRAYRRDRGWRCEPTPYQRSRPGVNDNRCHGEAENDASYDAMRTESSRSAQTSPSIGPRCQRHQSNS